MIFTIFCWLHPIRKSLHSPLIAWNTEISSMRTTLHTYMHIYTHACTVAHTHTHSHTHTHTHTRTYTHAYTYLHIHFHAKYTCIRVHSIYAMVCTTTPESMITIHTVVVIVSFLYLFALIVYIYVCLRWALLGIGTYLRDLFKLKAQRNRIKK